MTNKIPIVLATDKNLISQMYTTIHSAILNKKPETFYDFYCLIPTKFSKNVVNKFQKLEKKYKNVRINFKIMKNAFDNIEMQIAHITTPTYYRLLIAELLPNYEKAIYLDVDTVVLDDLSEMYSIDLVDNYVAGVRAASYYIDYIEKKTTEYYNSMGLKNIDFYINAGVMLWNLEEIRKDNMTGVLLDLSKNIYKFMDQDIINLAFYGKIKHIDFKYNLMVAYKSKFIDIPERQSYIEDFYGKENLYNAIKKPVIIHYAAPTKPWNDRNLWLADKWLYYAKKTPIKIKIKCLKSREDKFCELVNAHKLQKLVFWGASLFLEKLLKEKRIKHSRILGIIDKNPSRHGEFINKYEIFPPERLKYLKPDIIISAIVNKNTEIYPQIQEYIENNHSKIKLLPDIFRRK